MLSLIGIGGAGCWIVDDFYKRNAPTGLFTKFSNTERDFTGVASDTSDKLTKLKNIPASNMILIGKSRTKGHGAGLSVELGKKVMTEESELVLNLMHKAGFRKDDLLILFSGIGGGTGTGSVPVIAERIKKGYKAPLLGVFVLPSDLEGKVYTKNAYENLKGVVSSVDGAILLDNQILVSRGEDIISSHKMIDDSIFNFFTLLLAVEANILANTFDSLSTIAYAQDNSKDISIKGTIEKMIREGVFLKFDIKDCEKMVFIVKGNLDTLFDQDFARGWIKKKFGCEVEFVFKDEPNSKQTAMGLLIVGIKDLSNRFDELVETALFS